MKKQSPSNQRHRAVATLKDNVFRQNYIPKEGNPAYAEINGRKIYMPAYIPYIGKDYFRHRPRVMCYAINQNLSKHRRWTSIWTTEWAKDIEIAVDRLNFCAEKYGTIPIKPYTEGFIPLAAAMALKLLLNDSCLLKVIDQVICVTNFIQFSTSSDASSSSIPDSWWRECACRYIRKELLCLNPDVILVFGRRTEAELKKVLDSIKLGTNSCKILPCRFPSRIPSEKSRKLSFEEAKLWSENILPLVDSLRKPPPDAFHSWRMLRFSGYFVDLYRSWEKVL